MAGAARARPQGGRQGRARIDGGACARDARFPSRRAFRPSTTATTSARWRRRKASPTRSISPASCRPISARCSAAASARSAGRRCRAIPRTSIRTDAKVKELMPDDRHLHHWLDMARERIRFQGLPARICWVGLGDRHRLGLAFNEMVALGRVEGAGRDRPRSSRLRLRRLAQPRNRGDARRLRRRLRLAAAQCAAELRVAARPGSRCITAAASAWASRSTPAW